MSQSSEVTIAASAEAARPAQPSIRRGHSLAYQASLDGLRAVAVLLVMLYHAGVGWAHGGFLGVDIFFVLSGYLITSLLLDERARWGSIDLRSFWVRRARRLLPALFLMLGVVGLAAPSFVAADRLSELRGDGFATLAYVANWRLVLTGQSYFDQFAAPSPFRHMWSLGIEEQWYWFFPLLLMLVIAAGRRRRRRVAGTLAALCLASAALMAWLSWLGMDASRLYYGTDTRIQELLVGSVLAVLLQVRRLPMSKAVEGGQSSAAGAVETIVGLVGGVAVVAVSTDTSLWLYRGGFLALCVSVALLLDGLRRSPRSPVARLLSQRLVVLVGVVSYGLYLWHWPVFLFLTPDRTGLGFAGLLALRFVVTFAIASASYVVLERPIRSGVLRRRVPASWLRAMAVSGVAVVVAALMIGTSGAVAPPPIQASGALETRLVTPALGQHSVLILGDSPGRFLSWYLPRDVLSRYALSSSTAIGCGLLPQTVVVGNATTPGQPQCDAWPAQWQRAAELAKPQLVVLSVGYWELFDKQVDGHVLRVGTPAYAVALIDRLEQVRTIATGGAVPLLVLNVPCMGQGSYIVGGLDLEKEVNDTVRQQQINQVIAEFAARHKGDVTVLDDRSLLCPAGRYQRLVDGVEVRPDGVHVGGPGGRLVGEWLKPLLDRAMANR